MALLEFPMSGVDLLEPLEDVGHVRPSVLLRLLLLIAGSDDYVFGKLLPNLVLLLYWSILTYNGLLLSVDFFSIGF